MFPVLSSMPSYKMGWTEAMSQFPRIEAHMALTSGGSEGWVSDYDQFFKHVADINVRDLEDAFLVHNNPHGMEHFEERITRHAIHITRCQLVTFSLVNMVTFTWLTRWGLLNYSLVR